MEISFMPIKHRIYAILSILTTLAMNIVYIYMLIAYSLLDFGDMFDIIYMLPVALMLIATYWLYDDFYRISACRITFSPEGVVCIGTGKHIELSWLQIVEVGITYSTYGGNYKGNPPEYVLQNKYLYLSGNVLDKEKRQKIAAIFRKRCNSTVIAVSVDGQEDKIDEVLNFIKRHYSGELVVSLR